MFRLCLEIGCPHPDFLKAVLNKRQICEWLAFSKIHPFGYARREFSNALQTYHLLSGWLQDFEGDPMDFMPNYDDGEKTEAQLIADEILESL